MRMYIYEDGYLVAYLFNKKRLIKVLNTWGISNWKEFLKKDYTSDDTEQMVFAFADNNWKYKKIVGNKISDG